MKTVLCYGDSNTWGYAVGSINFETGRCERYPYEVRWPGRLQKLLGQDYLVVEEGLCGRTTNIDNPDGEGMNGKSYLLPCLFSHAPIDWVVLMLGANDFKTVLNRSAEDAARGLEELIQIIQQSAYGPGMQSPPKILLLGYPYVDTDNRAFADFFEGAPLKSRAFPALCEKIAVQYGCDYLDMSKEIALSVSDGLHIDEQDQSKFANLVTAKLLAHS